MSQTLIPKDVANRRSFLALAVATAAIVPISGNALARDRHDHSKAATAPGGQPEGQLGP